MLSTVAVRGSLHFCYKHQSLIDWVFFPNIFARYNNSLRKHTVHNSVWNSGKFPFSFFFLRCFYQEAHLHPLSLSEVYLTWQEFCDYSKWPLFPPKYIPIIFVSGWPNFNYTSTGHEATHMQISALCHYSLSQIFNPQIQSRLGTIGMLH